MAKPTDIDARKYYRVAKQRMDEAKKIADIDLPAAAVYLAGYAVECMLKAFLLTQTPKANRPSSGRATIDWLKQQFGHDLNDLRVAVARQGGQMPRPIAGEFLLVASWDPELRYEPGPGDPREAERFLRASEAIINWIDGRI